MRIKGNFYKNAASLFTKSIKMSLRVALILLICNCALANKIIYVDDDAAGANDGSSWQNAYIYLQDALANANSSEKSVEIHVAQGIYKPDQGAGQTAGDREATFELINDVMLYGGYGGILESDPNERDIEKYETILSGDLIGNDIDVNNPNELLDEPTRSENSFTIVRAGKVDTSSLINGFNICRGNQNVYFESGLGSPTGVGIHISEGKPIISNCKFAFNSGDCAMSIVILSEPTITKCMFFFNTTGISNYHSEPNISNCKFSKNQLAMRNYSPYDIKLIGCDFTENYSDHGGAIYNHRSNLTINNCSFIKNASYKSYTIRSGNGGAIYDSGGTLILNNCMFVGNIAEEIGGGIYEVGYNVTLKNCTFTENISKEGRALAHESTSNKCNISDCILWDDGNEIWYDGSEIMIEYSDIKGGQSAIYGSNNVLIWGEGNIDNDPLFADPNFVAEPNDPNAIWIEGDYHLKSQAGRFEPNTQTWVQDDVTSPCIDTGDPNSPIGLEPFPNGGRINMGAFGGTLEASKSYFGKPVCTTIIAGDINGDCKVDEKDLEILMLHWLEEH